MSAQALTDGYRRDLDQTKLKVIALTFTQCSVSTQKVVIGELQGPRYATQLALTEMCYSIHKAAYCI